MNFLNVIVSMIKFSPFSLVIFPHYRCFFPIPFPHSNNGEKLPVLTFSPLFFPILGMGKWGKLFSPLFSPILGQRHTTFFPIFWSFFSPFAARRRSDFDIRIGRLIGGARDGLKFGSPGAQERACCRMGKIRMGKIMVKIMGKNNGENEWGK